jgi:hypothetical protein
MDFQIWLRILVTPYKKLEYGLLSCNVFETLEYCTINVLKNKDALNEYIMNLIFFFYELFEIPKNVLILKVSLMIENDYFLKLFLTIFSKCFILTSWLEIGNIKIFQLQLYLNIQILIQFSNTLKLDYQ